MQPTVGHSYIESSPDICGGRARISGHRIRVQDIVLWTEQGDTPDDIIGKFPDLSLAQVHAALSYYFDYRDEINQQMREDERFAEDFESTQGSGPIARLGGSS